MISVVNMKRGVALFGMLDVNIAFVHFFNLSWKLW
jgi:hypothetical protein